MNTPELPLAMYTRVKTTVTVLRLEVKPPFRAVPLLHTCWLMGKGTHSLRVEVRSGGHATVAQVSLFVYVESVRSFAQTGQYSGNRDRTPAIGLDECYVTAHLIGSLQDDYGSAFLLH